MAFSNIFGAKKHRSSVIKVKTYSINQFQLLGSGAFGVIFKGSDAKKNTIAAKRIDGNVHQRVLTQDLNRLMKLDHPNVMKILDVEKIENSLWMMMPFCELGDLNQFYKTRDVSSVSKIEGMKQIAAGISYLHSQQVIHRDIKPANILATSEIPLRLLLADFDVSKCLDPEVETSLMTSNVGTLAFKAPEFFQRTSPGKIEYHRNVDIYAAGLTFLAILQAEKGKRMLIPHIETPMDESELYVDSIGRLIAERIKYKESPEVNIVHPNAPAKKLKEIIREMTCVNPQERLSAQKVMEFLKMESVIADFQIKKINLIQRKALPVSTLASIVVTGNDFLILRQKKGDKAWISVLNRLTLDLINEIPSKCNHAARVIKHPRLPDYMLESCLTCREIRTYNINGKETHIVHRNCKIVRMCDGPAGSFLVVDQSKGVCKLDWNDNPLEEAQVICVKDDPYYTLNKEPLRFCYVERHDILLHTLKDKKENKGYEILAKKFDEEDILWRLSGPVDGRIIKPESMTCDSDGNAYVSDGATNRILKINSLTGEVLSILLIGEEENEIHSMRWTNTEPNLTLSRGNKISTYSIPE